MSTQSYLFYISYVQLLHWIRSCDRAGRMDTWRFHAVLSVAPGLQQIHLPTFSRKKIWRCRQSLTTHDSYTALVQCTALSIVNLYDLNLSTFAPLLLYLIFHLSLSLSLSLSPSLSLLGLYWWAFLCCSVIGYNEKKRKPSCLKHLALKAHRSPCNAQTHTHTHTNAHTRTRTHTHRTTHAQTQNYCLCLQNNKIHAQRS